MQHLLITIPPQLREFNHWLRSTREFLSFGCVITMHGYNESFADIFDTNTKPVL